MKSFKAKGKRVTNYTIDSIVELEPRQDAVEELVDSEDLDDDDIAEDIEEPQVSDDEVRDEINGQQRIF